MGVKREARRMLVLQNVINRFKTDIDVCIAVFSLRFSAERFSKPLEEVKPASADKRPTPKARIMSMVGGVPYRRIYASTGKEITLP